MDLSATFPQFWQRDAEPGRAPARHRSCPGAGSVLQGGEGRLPAPRTSWDGKGGRGAANWGPVPLIPAPQGKAVERQQAGAASRAG